MQSPAVVPRLRVILNSLFGRRSSVQYLAVNEALSAELYIDDLPSSVADAIRGTSARLSCWHAVVPHDKEKHRLW